jgi:hypothetical protein
MQRLADAIAEVNARIKATPPSDERTLTDLHVRLATLLDAADAETDKVASTRAVEKVRPITLRPPS